jgi:hypothetical protein
MATIKRISADTAIRARLNQLPQRIQSKISISQNGCWLWEGNIIKSGYGTLTTGSRLDCSRRTSLVHRFVYEMLVGPIAPKLQIDHICKIKTCVNPDHLRVVTHRFNTLRSDSAAALNSRKTHCPNGHPYDTIRYNGDRRCSICHAAGERARQKRIP